MSGPQSQRSRLIQSSNRPPLINPANAPVNPTSTPTPAHSMPARPILVGSIESLEQENARLREELAESNDLLQRHVKEMRHMQQQMQKEGLAPTSSSPDSGEDDIPVDPYVLAPLCKQYDQTILELQGAKDNFQRLLQSSKDVILQLTEENEQLRQAQIDDLNDFIGKSNGGEETVEVADLRESLQTMMNERDVLIAQIEELKQQLSDEQDRVDEVESKNVAQTNEIQEMAEALRFLEALQKEKTLSEQRVIQLSSESSEARAEVSRVTQECNLLSAHLSTAKQELEERSKRIQALEKELEDQSDAMSDEVQEYAQRVRELRGKLGQSQSDCEAIKRERDELRRATEHLTKDNQGMVQLMTGLEKQLTEFSNREERTEQLAHECKESAEKALVERDEAQAKAEYLDQELHKLREVRSKEVEERMGEHQRQLAEEKQAHAMELQSRDSILKESRLENAKLRSESDRLVREQKSLTAQVRTLEESLEKDRKSIAYACSQLTNRLQEAEEKASSQVVEIDQMRHKHKSELYSLKAQNQDYAQKLNDVKSRLEQKTRDVTTLTTARDGLVVERDRLTAELGQCREDLTSLREDLQRFQRKERESTLEQCSIEGSEHRIQRLEAALADSKRAREADVIRLQEELTHSQESSKTTLGAMQRRLDAMKASLDSTSAQMYSLKTEHRSLLAEKDNAVAVRLDALQRADDLEVALDESERRVDELSIQIAELVAKEGTRLKQLGALKSELATAKSQRVN